MPPPHLLPEKHKKMNAKTSVHDTNMDHESQHRKIGTLSIIVHLTLYNRICALSSTFYPKKKTPDSNIPPSGVINPV